MNGEISFKGFYCNTEYLNLKNEKEINSALIMDKSSTIPVHFLNMYCYVYTGKEIKELFITSDMLVINLDILWLLKNVYL